VTRAIAATQQLVSFCDAINVEHIDDRENYLYFKPESVKLGRQTAQTIDLSKVFNRPRLMDSGFQTEARFGDGFTPADRAFAGGPEAFPLLENEAAVEAFGRGHHQFMRIPAQGAPQMLQVQRHVFFPDADGGRHLPGGKTARAQKCRDFAPYGILPGGGNGRLLGWHGILFVIDFLIKLD
jgi:hypothetical protein